MKRCIFYLPYKLDDRGKGARMLRPRKMIQAFIDIGYEVYVIDGVSSERRKKIIEIKKQIEQGAKFDFMYAESHTEPTLLTDPNHLPTHPFLDFGFFKYVNDHRINIGLFYCDIYWKFDTYGNQLPVWKRKGALANYKYDILQYKKYLKKFYVPDMKMCEYLKEDKLTKIATELPPGAKNVFVEETDYEKRDFKVNPLCVFYVGGLGDHYQIIELVKAVYQTKDTKLIICCREPEWELEKEAFQQFLGERFMVVHKAGDELEPIYKQADICSLMFRDDKYREMAKPYKAYEYLAHEKPVLSTKGTAIGSFVEENNIGWNIEYEEKAISTVLQQIIDNKQELVSRIDNCKFVKQKNLWTSRAEQVVDDLTRG